MLNLHFEVARLQGLHDQEDPVRAEGREPLNGALIVDDPDFLIHGAQEGLIDPFLQ